MPDLKTTLHLDMLHRFQRNRANLPTRLYRAIRRELAQDTYGLGWGDPETVEPLKYMRDHYVLPYVKPDKIALEIGPGGGRWTRYLLGCGKLYVVDYYQEILQELRKNYHDPKMTFIKNNGTDFPGVNHGSIDFLFSFGCFVHLDFPVIESYLRNIKPLLKAGANAVIHYSDKTKIMAQRNEGFSENTPDRMRVAVIANGYAILEEDLTSMWHSSVIRFTV